MLFYHRILIYTIPLHREPIAQKRWRKRNQQACLFQTIRINCIVLSYIFIIKKNIFISTYSYHISKSLSRRTCLKKENAAESSFSRVLLFNLNFIAWKSPFLSFVFLQIGVQPDLRTRPIA